jgi:hypothetical protein
MLRSIELACEHLQRGGMCLPYKQVEKLFSSNGYPNTSAPTVVKQAWMRGKQKKRAMPKKASKSHRALPVPKVVVSMPATVRVKPTVVEIPPMVPNPRECRTAKYQRLRRWRLRNGYRTGTGMSKAFREWAILQWIHENLGGPVGNFRSCLDSSLWLRSKPC